MKENSLWKDAFRRLLSDKAALASLIVVVLYSVIAVLAASGW